MPFTIKNMFIICGTGGNVKYCDNYWIFWRHEKIMLVYIVVYSDACLYYSVFLIVTQNPWVPLKSMFQMSLCFHIKPSWQRGNHTLLWMKCLIIIMEKHSISSLLFDCCTLCERLVCEVLVKIAQNIYDPNWTAGSFNSCF